jgi:hypothetical protein
MEYIDYGGLAVTVPHRLLFPPQDLPRRRSGVLFAAGAVVFESAFLHL